MVTAVTAVDVVLGFLVYSYPMMVLTACSQHDYLLQLARAIHSLIMVAPPDLIDQLEQDELTHDPQGQTTPLLTA